MSTVFFIVFNYFFDQEFAAFTLKSLAIKCFLCIKLFLSARIKVERMDNPSKEISDKGFRLPQKAVWECKCLGVPK